MSRDYAKEYAERNARARAEGHASLYAKRFGRRPVEFTSTASTVNVEASSLPQPSVDDLDAAIAAYEAWTGPALIQTEVKTNAKVLWLLSDVHVGAKTFNPTLFKKHIGIARSEGAAAFLLGDMGEFVTSGSKVASAGAQFEQYVPKSGHPLNFQANAFVKYIDGLEVLGTLGGNHEERLTRQGYDLNEELARRLGCANLGTLASVKLGPIKLLLAHGEGTGAKYFEYRRRDFPNHDIHAGGHNHRLNIDCHLEGGRTVYVIRTGHYLGQARYGLTRQYSGPVSPCGSVLIYLNSEGLIEGTRILL